MLKKLVKNLKPSSTLLINETSKKLEDQGKKIFKFGFGQSPFKVPEDVVEELKNNAYQNKYLPMQGLEELRESVAKYSSKKKNYNYKAHNVIIGPGSKELMFLLQLLFDGEILLPAPSWVSYKPQAIIGRNKFHFIDTNRDNNWFPSPNSIEKIVSQNKNKKYLVEPYIPGRELTVATLGNKPLIVTDIISDNWYNYDAKYKIGASKHIIPAKIPTNIEKAKLIITRTTTPTIAIVLYCLFK